MKISVIIVAAGSGNRFKGDTPKQYTMLEGRTLLQRSIEAMNIPATCNITVAIAAGHEDMYADVTRQLSSKTRGILRPAVTGGATRSDSVRAALESLRDSAPSHVLIHDAARALTPGNVVERVIYALKDGHKGAVPTVPVTDTIKRFEGGYIANTVPRDELVAAQTPQGFEYNTLYELHMRAKGEHTDDSSLLERAKIPVKIIAGDVRNIKITTNIDILIAKQFLLC